MDYLGAVSPNDVFPLPLNPVLPVAIFESGDSRPPPVPPDSVGLVEGRGEDVAGPVDWPVFAAVIKLLMSAVLGAPPGFAAAGPALPGTLANSPGFIPLVPSALLGMLGATFCSRVRASVLVVVHL